MSAMKAIYTDIQELQIAAAGDEDSFIEYIEATGWVSPTEVEIRERRAKQVIAIDSTDSDGATAPRAA